MAPNDCDGLSDQERRALRVMERTLEASSRPGLLGLVARIRFRALVDWHPQALLAGGGLLSLAACTIMLLTVSRAMGIALASEGLLAGGVLLVARGARAWWWRRATVRSSVGPPR